MIFFFASNPPTQLDKLTNFYTSKIHSKTLAHPNQRHHCLETVKESKRRQLSMVINWTWRHEWLSFITTNVVSCHLRRQYLTKYRVSYGRFQTCSWERGKKHKKNYAFPCDFNYSTAYDQRTLPPLTVTDLPSVCTSLLRLRRSLRRRLIELTDPLKGGFWSKVHWRLLQTITCSVQQICGVDSSIKSVSTVPERKIN